ncbi:MAG: class I SAM-dependent methyltransferase [Actinobacteria bacterium]|nr:class I SAM-dependent methyltransferase [Actinomycetota bacterium]
MTEVAPSDHLRDVYEQRGREEYGEPVVPDPALDRKFEVLTEEIGRLLPAESFLDAGCGDGRYLAALALLGPLPERVVGVDIAESILDTARRATAVAGYEPELLRANLERLPLGGAEFDVVISVQVLEHLIDPAAGLKELARVLRPGCTLLLSTDNRRSLITRTLNGPRWTLARIARRRNSRVRFAFPHRSFTSRELTSLMRDSGLVVERTRTFRFSMVGASPRVRRVFNRIDRRLPDVGLGDILLVVARRSLP